MFYTSDTLITAVKSRSLIPSSQATYLSANFLDFANSELQIKIVPDLISIREDFFLKKKVVSITASNSRYPIPERAVGNSIKDLFYLDSSGSKYPIPRINIHDTSSNNASGSSPSNFYLYGDQIVLEPRPSSSSGSIEIWYYERPNQLVLTAAVAKITAVNTSGSNQVFTVDTDLTGSITNGTTKLDILSGKSPFLTWAIDCVAQSSSSTTITVTTASVAAEDGTTVLPQVNDYVCLAQQANIPMIPQELHPLLAEYVCRTAVQGFGDSEKLAQIDKNIIEMRRQALTIVANRVENAAETVVNRRGFNALSGFGWGY